MNTAEINVYQIYYQESQKKELFSDSIPLFNGELSIFFENNVILDLYKYGKIVGDFFGVLSWKAREKNMIRSKSIKKHINKKYDIHSFTYDKHDVLGYANLCHPNFRSIFTGLLEYLHIDLEIRPLIGLYQNAIITKPAIYIDYIENYLMPAMDYLQESAGDIQNLLFSDAEYKGIDRKILMNTIGVEYYPYHTFVLERLWSVYYQINRSKDTFSYYVTNLRSGSYLAKKVNSKGKIHKFNL